MRRGFIVFFAASLMTMTVWPSDLYKITIRSFEDATAVRRMEIDPLLRISNEYLVLSEAPLAADLTKLGIPHELVATNVARSEIGVDNRLDRKNVTLFPLLVEIDNLRLFRLPPSGKATGEADAAIAPLPDFKIEIDFVPEVRFNAQLTELDVGLDSLVGLVSRDSAESYLLRLESFWPRLTGTSNSYAARDWLASKFREFGYDSVITDTFTGSQLWGRVPVTSHNVIAVKVGSRYPGRQIIVGGHYDAVPDCPGADDNASGTAGVLEVARVLRNIETEMTFIFIAFDSEESWMWGSYYYADSAHARGDSIIYMLNLDMIGFTGPDPDLVHASDSLARLFHDPVDAYARLWAKVAADHAGILGIPSGHTASDHLPFEEYGYDVTLVFEYDFNDFYHTPSESSFFIDFDYMARMIKASLATVYLVNLAPRPSPILAVRDIGNGHSLRISWQASNPFQIDRYRIYYNTVPTSQAESLDVPIDSSEYTINGLMEGVIYEFGVAPIDHDGHAAIVLRLMSGIARIRPSQPSGLTALPVRHGVKLWWSDRDKPLDFDHYKIIRDGVICPSTATDTSFVDNDPTLGSLIHTYYVMSADADGNLSDTVGSVPAMMRAARLEENKILALNRSGDNQSALVDEFRTGQFLREALEGFDYTYIPDNMRIPNQGRQKLMELIDYGAVVIGAEGGRQDDIGGQTQFGGMLEDLSYYLSIGGKAVIFGRWGNLRLSGPMIDTVCYSDTDLNHEYADYFHLNCRVLPLTNVVTTPQLTLISDMIGAQSVKAPYPDLFWDSVETTAHSAPSFNSVSGIPFASYALLANTPLDTLYTYHSSIPSGQSAGQAVAWHYNGEYEYIFFNLPLSFMQRSEAVATLRQAVSDVGLVTEVAEEVSVTLPKSFALFQNYPNPFNPKTQIDFYNPLARPAMTTLEVFNILGQKVRVLFDGLAAPGINHAEWDGRDAFGKPVASGIYLYRLKSDDATLTRKMILMK